VPPRGYWAKLQAGKRVVKTPLPAAKPLIPDETIFLIGEKSKPAPEPPPRAPELQARIDATIARAQPIKVPKSLSAPHPIIQKWLDEDGAARERAREILYAPFHLSVTRRATLRRRLRIMSALLREFARIGYAVSAERDEKGPIVVRSRLVDLKFVIFEPMRHVRIPIPGKEGEPNQKAQFRHERQFSKELVLRIESSVQMTEPREWRDKPERPLERQVNDMARGLLTATALREHEREQQLAEEQRRWRLQQEQEERERRERAEAARWQQVVRLAESSLQAKMVREFLDQLERARLARAEAQGLSTEFQEWIAWARKRADMIDPLLAEKIRTEPTSEDAESSPHWASNYYQVTCGHQGPPNRGWSN